jgi:molybdate transport system ATP-binding protein
MGKPHDTLVARLVDFRNLFAAVVRDVDAERTVIDWHGRAIEAPPQDAYGAGARVCWGILPAHCILHRRDRPSRGERENPVPGVIGELLALGENASVALWVEGRREQELRFTVPLHVADRNRLVVGAEATVSLLREGVHLMPYDPLHRAAPAEDAALTQGAAAARLQS